MAGATLNSALAAVDMLDEVKFTVPGVGATVLALSNTKSVKWDDSKSSADMRVASNNAEVAWRRCRVYGVSRGADLVLSDAAGEHWPLGGRPMSSEVEDGNLLPVAAGDLEPGSRVLVQMFAAAASPANAQGEVSLCCLWGLSAPSRSRAGIPQYLSNDTCTGNFLFSHCAEDGSSRHGYSARAHGGSRTRVALGYKRDQCCA